MNFFYGLGFFISRCKYDYDRGRQDGYTPDMTISEKRIVTLLKEDPLHNYIPAIKLHRELFGSFLKEAKDAVDDLMARNGIVR